MEIGETLKLRFYPDFIRNKKNNTILLVFLNTNIDYNI